MDKLNVLLENGTQKEVDCIFYLYNQKYYFIYTEKELDENDYVLMNVVQVGKEVKQTVNGPVDTGFLIGIDSNNPDENQDIQLSITKIVEDMKNKSQSEDIKYLPISMLSNLKIVSKKTFRLLRNVVEQYFGLSLSSNSNNTSNSMITNQESKSEPDIIVDYRSKYFEEQEKNEELEKTITDLKTKLDSIKGIIG